MNLPSNSPWVVCDGPRPPHLSTPSYRLAIELQLCQNILYTLWWLAYLHDDVLESCTISLYSLPLPDHHANHVIKLGERIPMSGSVLFPSEDATNVLWIIYIVLLFILLFVAESLRSFSSSFEDDSTALKQSNINIVNIDSNEEWMMDSSGCDKEDRVLNWVAMIMPW